MRKALLFASMLLLMVASGCKKGNNEPDPTPSGERCSADKYKTVTIGTQKWMAENYRCTKYGTESEAYKAGLKEVPASNTAIKTPYCVNASDMDKWVQSKYTEAMTDANKGNLGYLYNWAAAVGLKNQADINRTDAFSGARQGICPNGLQVRQTGTVLTRLADMPTLLQPHRFLPTKPITSISPVTVKVCMENSMTMIRP